MSAQGEKRSFICTSELEHSLLDSVDVLGRYSIVQEPPPASYDLDQSMWDAAPGMFNLSTIVPNVLTIPFLLTLERFAAH